MKHFWIATLISATLLALVLFLMPRAAPVAAQRGDARGPFRAPPVNPVSFDGDVRRLPRAPSAPREIPRARRASRAPAPQIALRDPVRQSAPANSKWMTLQWRSDCAVRSNRGSVDRYQLFLARFL
ncbi:MAG: hypothetical protein HZC40_10465 [Chloroflexi bacterium]|nr:hypothetical protein [Chloroflexota bacterium]